MISINKTLYTPKKNSTIERYVNRKTLEILTTIIIESGGDEKDIIGSQEHWNEHYLFNFLPKNFPISKTKQAILALYELLTAEEVFKGNILYDYIINEIIESEIRIRQDENEGYERKQDVDKIIHISNYINENADLKLVKKNIIKHPEEVSDLDNYPKNFFT